MEKNKFITNDIFKSSLVGALAVLITLVPFDKLLGITSETFGSLPNIYLIPIFVIYTAIAFIYSKIKNNLKVTRKVAFLIIFSFNFIISNLLPQIEGKVYLENSPFFSILIQEFILSLIIVLFIFYLWKQDDNSEKGQIKSYFSSRLFISWIWRVIVIMILFYILTMIIGIISMPITGHFLEQGIMKVPSMLTLFIITIFRSFFYLLVTVPLIIFWKSSNKQLILYIAIISSLIYPILGDTLAPFWPVLYRLVDGFLLTFHTIIMSWLYVKMLKKGNRK
jgi:hypothetical protein